MKRCRLLYLLILMLMISIQFSCAPNQAKSTFRPVLESTNLPPKKPEISFAPEIFTYTVPESRVERKEQNKANTGLENLKIEEASIRHAAIPKGLKEQHIIISRGEFTCEATDRMSNCKKWALEKAKYLAEEKASAIILQSLIEDNKGRLSRDELVSQSRRLVKDWEDVEQGWVLDKIRYHTIRVVLENMVPAVSNQKIISKKISASPKKPEPVLGPPTYIEPVSGIRFVLIMQDCFGMGDSSGKGYPDENPLHEVCMSNFYLGEHEVTVKQWKKFIDDTKYEGDGESYWKCKGMAQPDFPQEDNHPITCVSWKEAAAFAEWVSKKTGKNYRLPTESEWEYVARNKGKKHQYVWGNGDPVGNIADESIKGKFTDLTIWAGYDDSYVYTSPIKIYPPNKLGIYDMAGNVWEWCGGWYDSNYYNYSPTRNPKGPDGGTAKNLRGGSWYSSPEYFRTVNRAWGEPNMRSAHTGFRLVHGN